MPDRPTQPESPIHATLAARGAQYGEFKWQAHIAQRLKDLMRGEADGWDKLAPDQAEALEMIAHKIARILNGNPNYHDSWHDIAGYATLVADRLAQEVP